MKFDRATTTVQIVSCRRTFLSDSERLICMYSAMAKDRALALRIGCDEGTVRRTRSLGCAVLLFMQDHLMGLLMLGGTPLDVFVSRCCWDETKHEVSVSPEESGLSSGQCMSDWSVLVQKRRFLALTECQSSPCYFTVLVPRAFLSSTGGAYIFTALFKHTALVEKISLFSRALAARAAFSFFGVGLRRSLRQPQVGGSHRQYHGVG